MNRTSPGARRRLATAMATALMLAASLAVTVASAVVTAAPAAADTAPPQPNSVTAFGSAPALGPGGLRLNAPFVGLAATPSGNGYWIAAGDGGIFTYGDATFMGSMGGVRLNQPVVGIASRPGATGYWQVASDGGIFTFGDAPFVGSTGNIRLNQPVVGMAATPTGNGYWLVARDGGIFAFGDAGFFGSTGNIRLNQPVVGMAPTVTGNGYWLVAADGGIFAFGDAAFHGSAAENPIPAPAVGIATSADNSGYWIAARDGAVYPFGAIDEGSAANAGSTQAPTVGITAHGHDGYWLVNGDRVITKISDSGDRVLQIQHRLNDLGYWVGPMDGNFGELTRQAVYAFQALSGLPVTGQADETTVRTLEQAARPRPQATSGDLIEVDKTHQVIFIVRGGQTQWVFHTSTGTEKPYSFEGSTYVAHTPTGNFSILRSVNGYDNGPLGQLYRPRYFTNAGHAIHGYTSVPPYPASHGCVRVTNAAMDFIWDTNLAPIGMAVNVYGRSPGT